MIPKVVWADTINFIPASPFLRKNANRPIYFTLHNESFLRGPADEMLALEMLMEFALLLECDLLNTSNDQNPYFRVQSDPSESGNYIIDVYDSEGLVTQSVGPHTSALSEDRLIYLIDRDGSTNESIASFGRTLLLLRLITH